MPQLSDYIGLFPSASRGHPRLMALAEAILRQAAELIGVLPDLTSAFSLDYASGEALSALGKSLGLVRPEDMADTDYRALIRIKLILWGWDGRNDSVQGVLDRAIPGATLSDNCNGSVTLHPAGTLPGAAAELFPVPAGVRAIT